VRPSAGGATRNVVGHPSVAMAGMLTFRRSSAVAREECMKCIRRLLATMLAGALVVPGAWAQSSGQKKAGSQPPVFVGTPPATVEPAAQPTAPPEALPSEQKLYGQSAPLVSTEQAQAVVDKFKEAYPKLGSPRLLIHVNRDVAADKTDSPKSASSAARTSDLPLTDRQTMRDIERLFGRPLRNAGANLTDQNAANAILGDKSIHSIEGTSPAAAEKRDSLAKVTDVVIEVLISPKSVTVTEISGERAYSVPDTLVTAIRLSDFKILGQATSNDFLGRILALRRFDANEITEATALALMEDMATGAR